VREQLLDFIQQNYPGCFAQNACAEADTESLLSRVQKEIGCAQRVLSLHAANFVVAERVLAEASM
jgi:hypothetical protein